MGEPSNEYAGSTKRQEIRFNVHPASWRNKTVRAAEKRLAAKIRKEVSQYGTIDLDAFKEDEEAYAPFIVEGFDEGGNTAYSILLSAPQTNNAEELAGFIDAATPELVEKINSLNGRIPERNPRDPMMEATVHWTE